MRIAPSPAPRRPEASGRTRRQNERGAALVELALVAPILVLLTLSVWEFGVVWLRSQDVVSASQAATRTVSQASTDESADQAAIRAALAALGPESSRIDRIVIFNAQADGSAPAACIDPTATSSPASAECNIYFQADFANVENDAHFSTGAGCGTGASANWCPSTRDNSISTGDWVGVLIRYDGVYQSGLFRADGYTINETSVMRVEPRPEALP